MFVSGMVIFDLVVEEMQQKGVMDFFGDMVFLLYDIFGFLIDLMFEIVEEVGFFVDCDGFDWFMQEQCMCVKVDVKVKKCVLVDFFVYLGLCVVGEMVFIGYDYLMIELWVLGILVDGVVVDMVFVGEIVEVILVEIVFYLEFGGQVVDVGFIVGNGFDFEVFDVQCLVMGLISYMVQVILGEVLVGVVVISVVDLVYWYVVVQVYLVIYLIYVVLWQIFGQEVYQVGFFNKVGYLWFDFLWSNFFSFQICSEIEDIVNNVVWDNFEVMMWILFIVEVKVVGVMVLFGEKYGDMVWMVDIGGLWLCEFCVGIYVCSLVEVGLVNFVSEVLIGLINWWVEVFVGLDVFCDFVVE